MSLSILYRGSLVSCNYACDYCPFAKRRESREEMERDRLELERFVGWVGRRRQPTSILFTPWGEALVRPWYRQALARLSKLPHVERVAIQTNLSAPLEWTGAADREALALWATYHPTQVTRARFLGKCRELDRRGVRYSAGVVGLKENLDEVEALRAGLDEDVYLWVNAYKREPDYYTSDELERLRAVDPLFDLNDTRHPSEGEACRAGDTVVSVDGQGTLRRCHFIATPLANIYDDGWEEALRPRPCTAATCGCYIGYVHMERLGLYETYGAGVLERIPTRPLWKKALPTL